MTLQTYKAANIAADTTAEIKLCKKCKHLRGNRNIDSEYDPERYEKWQCFLFPLFINVVNGTKTYENCADSRNNGNQCGILGNLYEEYVPLVRISEPTIGGKTIVPTEIVFDDAAITANREAAAKRLEELRKKNKTSSLTNIKAEEL